MENNKTYYVRLFNAKFKRLVRKISLHYKDNTFVQTELSLAKKLLKVD